MPDTTSRDASAVAVTSRAAAATAGLAATPGVDSRVFDTDTDSRRLRNKRRHTWYVRKYSVVIVARFENKALFGREEKAKLSSVNLQHLLLIFKKNHTLLIC